MLCKEKSAGRRKKVEKNRERRSGMHSQAIKDTAKNKRSVEKESSTHPTTEDTRALWRRHSG